MRGSDRVRWKDDVLVALKATTGMKVYFALAASLYTMDMHDIV